MLLLLGNPAQASYHLRSSPSLAALWILSVHEKKKNKERKQKGRNSSHRHGKTHHEQQQAPLGSMEASLR